jgi:uncharacterized protein (DUF2147 family)
MKPLFIAGLLAAAASTVFAQATPVGLWKTIDDETRQEKSFVRIVEQGGALTGKVEKLIDPAAASAKCDKCADERKDKPLVGLQIIRNAKAGEDGAWEGGEILDPNNGKTYRLRLKPLEGGKKLEVRGYIGPFYRNQQWIRVE